MPEGQIVSPADDRHAALAKEVISGYEAHDDHTRRNVEREVERIANPLRTGDYSTEDNTYVQEDEMFDTTVREAKVVAINGIMSRMFPFSDKWFQHTFKAKTREDKPLEEKHIRALEQVSDLQFRQLGADNFYGATKEGLSDYLDFGNINVRMTKGKRRFAHFQAVEKGLYVFQLDDEGFADIVWCKYKMTAYMIETQFGPDALPQKIKDALKDPKKKNTKFELIHRVQRRKDFREGTNIVDPSKREYESLWASTTDGALIGNSLNKRRKVIYEDGLYENPYTIGRLMSRAGQNQGDGLTTMMLPAIRTANSKAQNIEKAENLAVDPPWYVPDDQTLDSILPGSEVNFDAFNPEGRAEPIQYSSIGIDYEKSGLSVIQESIKEAFFVNAFKIFTNIDVATNRKTAFESRLIKAEQLSLLITLLYGLAEEYVKPMLTKHLNMMIREGQIPEDIIEDLPEDFDIELTSQFAKSIESTKAEDLMTLSDMAAALEIHAPGVGKSTVKWEQAFRKVALQTEVEVEDLYTSEEAQELMDAERERQAAMQQAAIANQAGDAASKLSQAQQ